MLIMNSKCSIVIFQASALIFWHAASSVEILQHYMDQRLMVRKSSPGHSKE